MHSPETERARELRNNMSGTERRVWYRLRGRRLGFKFRRQLPIGPYFADFACLSARLVIEIDGGEHHEEAQDARKTSYLESQGFRVVRIGASQTDQHLEEVIERIWSELQSPIAPPGGALRAAPTSPQGGEVKSLSAPPGGLPAADLPRKAGR